MPSDGFCIRGVHGIPEIQPGADLGRILMSAVPEDRRSPGLILVVAQKVVSKAEGRIMKLDSVTPSTQAEQWAEELNKDPRMVEVILRETRRVVRMDRGILIAETHQGYVCANAGVDASNAPAGSVVLLPEDPDRSAAGLRMRLEKSWGLPLSVIISDTFGRPWRRGLTNVALGISGVSAVIDYRGQRDQHGRTLQATVLAVADELAAAAELVMGKNLGIPAATVQGYRPGAEPGTGRDLLRPAEEDLFR